MKKITVGFIMIIGLAAISLLAFKNDDAYKADCCSDGSKCCTQSCCEDHK